VLEEHDGGLTTASTRTVKSAARSSLCFFAAGYAFRYVPQLALTMNRNFLKTNEHEEAVSSLEVFTISLENVSEDVYYWKWAILALHNSLQGFMVLALRGGNGILPLKDHIAEAWLKAYREGKDYPKEELDTFLNLYKKIKSNNMNFFGHSIKFMPKGTQGYSVKKLNRLRNDFIHFLPKSYLLEVSVLPKICLDCISIIEFLGWKCGNIHWYYDKQEARATIAISKAKSILNGYT